MAREYKLISADSHILEPPHLWREYMPKKFHDKAPKVVPDGDGGEAWQFAPDIPPAPDRHLCFGGAQARRGALDGGDVRRGQPGQLPRAAAAGGAGPATVWTPRCCSARRA